MKILVVCQNYYPENFVISKIAEKLVSFGHDVSVLTGKPNYGYGYILPEYKNIKFEVINGVKVNRVNLVARKKGRLSIIQNYLSFWNNAKKWIRRTNEKFDIVYSMSLSPVTILAPGNLYKKKHGVKHVVHCVDLWPESVLITNAVREKSIVYKILYKWSKDLYSKADEILLGSPSYEEYFKTVLKLTDKQYKFVPQPSLVEQSDIEPAKLDDNYFHILYCGNLGRVQLIDLIPNAMAKLTDKKIKFHIIGMGPMTEMLESKIKELNLSDCVVYHGPIPAERAAAYFKSADALYVSLNNGGYVGKTIPNKLAMSMAFGKPILAVLDGDGKDVVINSDGGIVCEQNADSLAEGINKIASTSKEELKRLGDNNLTYYRNNFSLEKVTRIIEKELIDKTR